MHWRKHHRQRGPKPGFWGAAGYIAAMALPWLIIALGLWMSGCVETYYQCRQHASREFCLDNTAGPERRN